MAELPAQLIHQCQSLGRETGQEAGVISGLAALPLSLPWAGAGAGAGVASGLGALPLSRPREGAVAGVTARRGLKEP